MQLLELLKGVTCEMDVKPVFQNSSFYCSISLKEGRR